MKVTKSILLNHLLNHLPVPELEKLILDNVSSFKLCNLAFNDQLSLLNENYTFFSKFITIKTDIGFIKKVPILIRNTYNQQVKDLFVLTDKDLNVALKTSATYLIYDLYCHRDNILKYFRKELFERLSVPGRKALFLHHPEFLESQGYTFKIYQYDQYRLVSSGNIDYIEKNFPKFKPLDSEFWIGLISLKKKRHKKLFLENLNRIATDADLRAVFTVYPSLCKMITLNHIQNSKTDAKYWINTFDQVKTSKYLKGWELPDDIKEYLKEELAIMVLKGSTRMTDPLKRSMRVVK